MLASSVDNPHGKISGKYRDRLIEFTLGRVDSNFVVIPIDAPFQKAPLGNIELSEFSQEAVHMTMPRHHSIIPNNLTRISFHGETGQPSICCFRFQPPKELAGGMGVIEDCGAGGITNSSFLIVANHERELTRDHEFGLQIPALQDSNGVSSDKSRRRTEDMLEAKRREGGSPRRRSMNRSDERVSGARTSRRTWIRSIKPSRMRSEREPAARGATERRAKRTAIGHGRTCRSRTKRVAGAEDVLESLGREEESIRKQCDAITREKNAKLKKKERGQQNAIQVFFRSTKRGEGHGMRDLDHKCAPSGDAEEDIQHRKRPRAPLRGSIAVRAGPGRALERRHEVAREKPGVTAAGAVRAGADGE
jgi:hypothetical protein